MTLFNLKRTKRRRRRPASFCFFQYLAEKGRTTRASRRARRARRTEHVFYSVRSVSSGNFSGDMSREMMPAMPVVLSTNARLNSGMPTDAVPMLASAVCAMAFIARKRDALTHLIIFDLSTTLHCMKTEQKALRIHINIQINIQRLNPLFLFYRSILDVGYY